jgi:hydroxyisourate hydrolase
MAGSGGKQSDAPQTTGKPLFAQAGIDAAGLAVQWSDTIINRSTRFRRHRMGRLSTHVLDTTHGRPARGMAIELLEARPEGGWAALKTVITNADGRTEAPLLTSEEMRPGRFQLRFHVGAYFRALGVDLPDPAFLEHVPIQFGIADSQGHYHVPLVCTPWSYSTYRGS